MSYGLYGPDSASNRYGATRSQRSDPPCHLTGACQRVSRANHRVSDFIGSSVRTNPAGRSYTVSREHRPSPAPEAVMSQPAARRSQAQFRRDLEGRRARGLGARRPAGRDLAVGNRPVLRGRGASPLPRRVPGLARRVLRGRPLAEQAHRASRRWLRAFSTHPLVNAPSMEGAQKRGVYGATAVLRADDRVGEVPRQRARSSARYPISDLVQIRP